MAEGAPLLRVYTLIAYRGFESLSLRHIKRTRRLSGFLCLVVRDENPIEGTINSCNELRQGAKRRSPEGVVTALRLKQSIPLSPPYKKDPTLVGFFMLGG